VPRVARIKSKSGIYHVIMRGINRDFCKLISLEIMAFSESKKRTSPPFLPNLLVTKQPKQKRKEKSLMNIRQGYVFSLGCKR